MKCAWHLCDNELPDLKRNRKFCSKNCKYKHFISLNRRKTKERALEIKGGKCLLCGYAKCSRALQFHHVDEQAKDFSISRDGSTTAWSKVLLELDKCILVCSNCHAEIHAGLHPEYLRASEPSGGAP